MQKANYMWVGFDLDGTLARNDHSSTMFPPFPIGEPVEVMVNLARNYIKAGWTIKIFTARACDPEQIPQVRAWCLAQGLGELEITNKKDFLLAFFFDDRAVPVRPNAGVAREIASSKLMNAGEE